jgi:integrase
MLATAERKAMIAANPMARVEQIPNAEAQVDDLEETDEDEDDYGDGLDDAELQALIAGFKPSPSHYPVVATAAATGARRNELLALRWTDLDVDARTLRIERAWEQTKKFGLRLKPPKTKRGLRTITLDAATIAMLLEEKARHQRIKAAIPDGVVEVDLSLVRLPPGALMFPATPTKGGDFDFSAPRNPRNFSKEYARRAKRLGFVGIKFHTLRGVHATALLDLGMPVNRVADRIGDDPITLMRAYAKRRRTKKANDNMTSAIEAFAAGFMKP